jgi:hypothetical protein
MFYEPFFEYIFEMIKFGCYFVSKMMLGLNFLDIQPLILFLLS